VKIGFHSPMPPARTGVADYSAALAQGLREAGHEVALSGEGDVELYHIGNNPLHRDIYERALRRPGVVVIHDAVLHHFHLGFGDERRYVEEFVFNYGEWNRGLAAQLWQGRAQSGSGPVYFSYPMLKRIASNALAVMVHNPGAAAMVRDHAPSARIIEIPHLLTEPPPVDPHTVLALRHRWNLPAGACLFGVFGHLRESKRLGTVLAAARRTGAWVLVAGDIVSSDYARSMEAELHAADRIIRVPYLTEADFWAHAYATDVCVNLRYPAAGETSGIAIRLMSISKALIVSAGPETAHYPDDACLRIDTGVAEEAMLAAYMAWLQQAPVAAKRLGGRACEYVRTRHTARSVVEQLTALLGELVGAGGGDLDSSLGRRGFLFRGRRTARGLDRPGCVDARRAVSGWTFPERHPPRVWRSAAARSLVWDTAADRAARAASGIRAAFDFFAGFEDGRLRLVQRRAPSRVAAGFGGDARRTHRLQAGRGRRHAPALRFQRRRETNSGASVARGSGTADRIRFGGNGRSAAGPQPSARPGAAPTAGSFSGRQLDRFRKLALGG
jgi:hypothetical protein